MSKNTAVTLQNIRRKAEHTEVPANDASMVEWSDDMRFIATAKLNACTAVAIVSEYGAILAHIAPLVASPGGTSVIKQGEVNHQDLLKQITDLYDAGLENGTFPPASSFVLAGNAEDNSLINPAAVKTIRECLVGLGLPIKEATYRTFASGKHGGGFDETSLIIEGAIGYSPRLLINDQAQPRPQALTAAQVLHCTRYARNRLIKKGLSRQDAITKLVDGLAKSQNISRDEAWRLLWEDLLSS